MQYSTTRGKNLPSVANESIIGKGKIRFPGVHSKYAEYIRMKSDISTFSFHEHIYSEANWGLTKPQLIISISGPRLLKINNRMKKAFKRGLVEVTENTNSWILTDGANIGVSKLVGEAISEMNSKTKPSLIGILPWRNVMHKNILMSSSDQSCRIYGLKDQQCSFKEYEVVLDSNHSHFLLIDNQNNFDEFLSEENIFMQISKYRSGFENQLRKKRFSLEKKKPKRFRSAENVSDNILDKSVNDDLINSRSIKKINVEIPMISIIINGGLDCLLVVKENILKKMPTLLLEGTKGAADLISKTITVNELTEDSLKLLIDESKILKKEKNMETYNELLQKTKDRLLWIREKKSEKLVYIFKIGEEDDSSNIEGLELAILRAFLNSQKKETFENFKLALKWDRIDIAKNDILNGEESLSPEQGSKLLELALVENKPDFVELILQNGVNLDSFLTYGRLYYLYNSEIIQHDSKRTPLFEICKLKYNCRHDEIFINFKKLKSILKEFTVEDIGFKFLPDDLVLLTEENESAIKDYLDDLYDEREINGDFLLNDLNVSSFLDKINFPAQNLFVWALLLDRIEIAKHFWLLGSYQMANALFACMMFKRMSIKLPQSRLLRKQAEEFRSLAIEVLNLIDISIENCENHTLLKKLDFCELNCLEIAFAGSNYYYMSHAFIQNILDNEWLGKVANQYGHLSNIKFVISCFSFGLLAPLLLFESRQKTNIGQKEESEIEHLNKVIATNSNKDKVLDREKFLPQKTQKKTKNNNNFWNHFIDFFCSPRTRFTYQASFFIIFLSIFSYFMLCELKYYEKSSFIQIDLNEIESSNSALNFTIYNSTFNASSLNKVSISKAIKKKIASPHILEYVLAFWIFSFFIEECRQFLKNGAELKSMIVSYFRNNWNYLDVFGCLFFLIGISFRFLSLKFGLFYFNLGRILLCFDLAIWYLRLLHLSIVFQTLGPKLVMIQKMINDLMTFMILIAIFVSCFGVVTQSALYPESKFNIDLIRSIFTKAYWPIYGTMKILEDFDKHHFLNCDERNDCPEESGVIFSYMLLMIYMVLSNVLLINLLIAMFSSTYNRLQENTDCIWKFQRYKLVNEFKEAPILPPPFSLLFYVCKVLKNLFTQKRNASKKEKNPTTTVENTSNTAEDIEKRLAEEYIYNVRKSKKESNDTRLKHNYEKLDLLETKVNLIIEFQSKHFKKNN